MLTLRPYQVDAIAKIREVYASGTRAVLYALATGAGKTVTFAHIAQEAAKRGNKVLILVHRRELLMQGSRALRGLSLSHGLIMPGLPKTDAQVRIASVQTLIRRLDHVTEPDLIVIDECFPAMTMIQTPKGLRPIEQITVGEEVLSFDDQSGHFVPRRVTRAFVRVSRDFVKVQVGNLSVECTPDHPFWVGESRGGWKAAQDLTYDDMVLTVIPHEQDRYPALHELLPTVPMRGEVGSSASAAGESLLLDSMQRHLGKTRSGEANGLDQSEVRQPTNDRSESNAPSGGTREGQDISAGDGVEATNARGERAHESAPMPSGVCPRLGNGSSYQDGETPSPVLRKWTAGGESGSSLVQDRHSQPTIEDRDRGGWGVSQHDQGAVSGQEENGLLSVAWMDHPAVQEFRSDGGLRSRGPSRPVYNLEVEGTHTYIANGFVVHNCHHAVAGSWLRVLNHWPKARVLGVTATPARLDGRGLGTVFEKLVIGPSMGDLVAHGFLAPCDVYAPPVVADLNGMHTRLGDFDKHEVQVRMDRPAITGDCVEHYSRLTPGKLGIAFCSSVEHARHVAEAFSAAGFPSESIDGSMSDFARDSLLARFSAGEIRVLTSCEIVSEGFDLPECEVAVLLRPTQSVTVYLQQVGRVMRPADGKGLATILDHVGNVERHGLPDAKREWSLDAKRKSPKAPPIRRCPACFAVFAPAAVCPQCGYVFVAEPRAPIAHREGTLARVERDTAEFAAVRERMKRHAQEQGACQTVEELIALGIRRGYANPKGWAWRVMQGRQVKPARERVTA